MNSKTNLENVGKYTKLRRLTATWGNSDVLLFPPDIGEGTWTINETHKFENL